MQQKTGTQTSNKVRQKVQAVRIAAELEAETGSVAGTAGSSPVHQLEEHGGQEAGIKGGEATSREES